MRLVLDTNVLMSGVFFGGVPGSILQAWRDGVVELVFSPSIFEEYRSVARRLAERYPSVTFEPALQLLLAEGVLSSDAQLTEGVSADPDDDKFLACAVASGAAFIISGDRHLLNLREFHGVSIRTPRQFADEQLIG